MGISIASAFRLRNKLKERIKELTNTCERTPVTKHRGTEENTTRRIKECISRYFAGIEARKMKAFNSL
jgi:predicted DNA-binding protein